MTQHHPTISEKLTDCELSKKNPLIENNCTDQSRLRARERNSPRYFIAPIKTRKIASQESSSYKFHVKIEYLETDLFQIVKFSGNLENFITT